MTIVPGPDSVGQTSILVVSHKILLKDLIHDTLMSFGDVSCEYVQSSAQALEKFKSKSFHIVISELSLDGSSAFELVKSLGGNFAVTDDIYFVCVIEEDQDSLRSFADELESHQVLVKPVTSTVLKKMWEEYKKWRALPRLPWQNLMQEGLKAARERRFPDAESNFNQVLLTEPNSADVQWRVGHYFLKKPDFAKAEEHLKKAIKLKSDCMQAFAGLGQLYLLREDWEQSDFYFKKAYVLSPLHPERGLEMMRLYLVRAGIACRDGLKVDPGAAGARFHFAKLLAVSRDYVGVVREIEKAMPLLREEQKAVANVYLALARKLGGIAKN